MDIMSIAGLLVALVAVVAGMFFKGVSFTALLNPAAFSIILLGTIGAVLIATPAQEIKNIGKLFAIVFGKTRHQSPEEAIERMVSMAEIARKQGLLSLEPMLNQEEDPFMAHSLQLLVDGANSERIYESLGDDLAAMESRHAAGAQIFTQAGTYAPTLGVLGAVLGLIAALGDLNDVEKLGHAISAAFIATLLGIFTGYVLWHPMANKLKRKSKQEVLVCHIIMEGTVAVCSGKNPKMIRDDLMSFIPSRTRMLGGKGSGGKGGRPRKKEKQE